MAFYSNDTTGQAYANTFGNGTFRFEVKTNNTEKYGAARIKIVAE